MQGKLEIGEQQFDIEARRQSDAIIVTLGGQEVAVTLQANDGGFAVQVGEEELQIDLTDEQKNHLGASQKASIAVDGTNITAQFKPKRAQVEQATLDAESLDEGSVTALMPGTIVRILVEENQTVASGDVLLILEAMKMENEIKAPISGVVASIAVEEAKPVNKGDLLIHLNGSSGEETEA